MEELNLLLSSLSLDKGFATVLAAIFGATIAAVISITVASRSFKQQIILLDKNLEHQKKQFYIEYKERQESIQQNKIDSFNNKKTEHLEKTYYLLSKLKFQCSPTSSFILTRLKELEKFDAYYTNEIVEKINQIQTSVRLYFPSLKDDIDNINGKANMFWGYQQQYLSQDPSSDAAQSNLGEVHKAVHEISSLAGKMQNNLKNEFDKIYT